MCRCRGLDTSGHSCRGGQRPCRSGFPHLQAPPTLSFWPFCRVLEDIPMRPSRRAPDELRAVSLERGVVKYAEGSCMVKFGDTHVLVTATLEERLPPWPVSYTHLTLPTNR